MLAFSELRKGTPSMRLPEGVDILLASLQVGVTSVSLVLHHCFNFFCLVRKREFSDTSFEIGKPCRCFD